MALIDQIFFGQGGLACGDGRPVMENSFIRPRPDSPWLL